MAHGGGTRFNSCPRGEGRGRRMEEDTDKEHDWGNRDPYGDGEDDPRPIRTPGRRPFPPARRPEMPDPQVRRIEVKAPETEDDILAGIRVTVSTEITGEEATRAAALPDEDKQ